MERNVSILPIDNDIRKEVVESWVATNNGHVLMCTRNGKLHFIASSGKLDSGWQGIIKDGETFTAKHDQTLRAYKGKFTVLCARPLDAGFATVVVNSSTPLYCFK